MAIRIEYEKKDRAIELPNGTILDIPERTKANDEKVQEVLKTRTTKNEYEFLYNILLALFGREGVKEIIPDATNANLDYLTAVYTTSVNLFYEDKVIAEREELTKRAEELDPITNKLKVINPLIDKIK